MPFKGKRDGAWFDASAVYGKSGGSWLYGKEAWAKKDGSWQRAWTDCRLFDQGGRDWSAPSITYSYTGTCGNRQLVTTVTRTKTGCPNDVRISYSPSPNCTTDCFDISTDSCNGCGSRTIYTAKAGTNCTSYTTGSCGTWNPVSSYSGPVSITINGVTYYGSYGGGYTLYEPCDEAYTAKEYFMYQCSSSGAYKVDGYQCVSFG